MVSAAVADPVVKTVVDTVAVHDTARSRSSVTVTVPSCADLVAVPEGTDPRFAVAGTVMARLAAPAAAGAATTAKAMTAPPAASRGQGLARFGAPVPGARAPGTRRFTVRGISPFYATEWVTVPVYRPATCWAPRVKVSVGFQVAELFPTPA